LSLGSCAAQLIYLGHRSARLPDSFRIRTEEVAAVEINLPPLSEQTTIAAHLDAEFSAARTLQAAVTAKLAEMEKLPAALLRAAFSPT
jgi:restriction endonuclease S subunit